MEKQWTDFLGSSVRLTRRVLQMIASPRYLACFLGGVLLTMYLPVFGRDNPAPAPQVNVVPALIQPLPNSALVASSGREVEAIKDISAKAIASAGANVEVVKWIFTVFALIAGGVTVYAFKSVSDLREAFRLRVDQEVARIIEVRIAVEMLMERQHFVQSNNKTLSEYETERKGFVQQAAGATIEHVKASFHQQAESADLKVEGLRRRVLSDLRHMRELIERVEAKERWISWIEIWTGMTYHTGGRPKDAIPYYQKGCDLSVAGDDINSARLTSCQYNLACCFAMTGRIDEALELLQTVLVANPERWSDIESDGDFENLKDDPRFAKFTDVAKKWLHNKTASTIHKPQNAAAFERFEDDG